MGCYVCVGLDPDAAQIPEFAQTDKHIPTNILRFVKNVVDMTHHVAAAYKPQIAYYEEWGSQGLRVLEQVCEYIRQVNPLIPIIIDAKRADIGRTSEAYVRALLDRLDADAVTVNPYLGMEAVKPFLDMTDRHIIVLCRTSNPGAGELQDVMCTPYEEESTGRYFATVAEALREGAANVIPCDPMPLYQFVALRVTSWNVHGNCAVVVGATAPQELEDVRILVGEDMLILVPGVGKQGGDLREVIRRGSGETWLGEIINNSSAIMFAYKSLKKPDGSSYDQTEWMSATHQAATDMNSQIEDLIYEDLSVR